MQRSQRSRTSSLDVLSGRTWTNCAPNSNNIRQDGAGTATPNGTLSARTGTASVPTGVTHSVSSAGSSASLVLLSVGWLRGAAATDLFGGFDAQVYGLQFNDASYNNTGASTGSRIWGLSVGSAAFTTLFGADRGGTQDLVGISRVNVNGGVTDTTVWQIVTCDNTTTNVVATTAPFTIGDVYDMRLTCPLAGAAVQWTIVDRTTATTYSGAVSTNIPRATASLGTVASGVATINATTRTFSWARMYVESAVG